MVVASSATERHAHEGLSDRIDLLVDRVHHQFVPIGFGQDFGPQDQVTRCDPALKTRIGQQVSGDLLLDESIEWLVLVEGLNHVITVTPSVPVGDVFIQTVRIRVASHIKPMPSISNPILRRTEQAIDLTVDRLGCSVLFKRPIFGRFRWQPDQIQTQTTEQFPIRCRRGRTKSLGLQSLQDKRVDRISAPIGLSRCRNRYRPQRPHRPKGLPLLDTHPGGLAQLVGKILTDSSTGIRSRIWSSR